MQVKEHDFVVLTADLPEQRLQAGDVGTVVHVYAGRAAVEVEFVSLDGETVALATLPASGVRAANMGEIMHARSMAST